MSLGSPRLHLRSTDSTNDRAKDLAARGAAHGTLVTAAAQTAGRGRQGRSWVAPAGEALLMSLVLREAAASLPLAAAVATAEAIGPDAMVKWPNDVLVDGRKVAGVLIERRQHEDWTVLGIGVNVAVQTFPPELAETAGSLGRSPVEVEAFLAELLDRLARWSDASQAEVGTAWSIRDALRGRQIAWEHGRGTATGLDGDGRLLVTRDGGDVVALVAGEVHLRG